jgi:outer membrane receptor protein involved in Fe transport
MMQLTLRKLLFSLFLLFISTTTLAQNFTLTGKLMDRQSNVPVPYATVMVKSTADDQMITGATTDEMGRFRVSSDSSNIYLDISFMGYDNRQVRDLSFDNGRAALGIIDISQNAQALDEVEITAERSVMEFKLDKRVFNVGKDISSSGMGAMEVLENVPSVNVDIEGNVTLRGNTGVQILINGKPSVLSDEGSNALGTITADMIESVEVITNPSAKYEAGGTSGILNVVLKKEEKKGFNGSASVNTGYPANHSVGVSLNRRTEKFNLFTQFGGGFRSLPSYSKSINRNKLTGEEVRSEGTEYRNEYFFNLTLGSDFHINEYNVITLSGNVALELEDQPSETEFSTFDVARGLVSNWLREETTSAVNPKYQYDLQYEKKFKNHKDHVLQFSTLGRFFGKEQESEFLISPLVSAETQENQRTQTVFYQRNFTGKLDYVNPITEKLTLELGSQFDMNDVGNDYTVSDNINDVWLVDTGLTNNFEFDQQVLGVYITGSYEGEKWGLKLGSRVEHTNLLTLLTNTNQKNRRTYTNFFPSVHTSYNVSKMIAFQVGYSRRIFRPRLWDLNPFFNIRNNFSIRQGNPNLLPEFGDSYELTAIFILSKLSLNSSIYHLYTADVIERVSYFENNVTITKPTNVGTRHKTGFELNGKYSPTKKISFNGDVNIGYFQRKGQFQSQDFAFTGGQWSSRLTGKFKLPKGFEAEISGDYQSGYKTVQNVVSGFAFMDLGLRIKLWDGKGVINASVRDLFASRIRESYVDNDDFYLYNFSQRGRFMTLGFSCSFGKGEAMTYSGRRHR